MDRTNELEEHVERLSGEVDEMRARMARLESTGSGHQNGLEPKSRRGFLRFGAGAVLGALGLAATKILPAAATTGNPVLLGNANSADAPTTIQTTGALARVVGAEALGFVQANLDGSGTFAGPLQGLGTTTGPVEGVDGWAQGAQAFGVYGLTDAGYGVVGESSTGTGLYARRSGRIRQDPMAAAGAPAYDPNLFEQIRDVNGVLWISGAIGVHPAVWRRVNSLRTDTADGLGNAFKPLRLADTRGGTGGVTGPVAGGSTKVFTIAGAGTGPSSIPADAVAVVGNLTAVGWNISGWLTIFPAGVAYDPNADPSTMNFSGGAYAWANSFIVGLGTGSTWGGKIAVYVGTLGSGGTNFIIDITGYIQ